MLLHSPLLLRHCWRHAFSMTEMVIAITVIGVIAGMVVNSYTGVMSGGKQTLANRKLGILNEALNRHAMADRPLARVAQPESSQDELLILLALQMRREDLVGSPYVSPSYVPKSSSSNQDYRLRYNGVRFELLPPGQGGTGLKVEFDGSDVGPPRSIPSGFDPYGR